jgi:hypothetical protein
VWVDVLMRMEDLLDALCDLVQPSWALSLFISRLAADGDRKEQTTVALIFRMKR